MLIGHTQHRAQTAGATLAASQAVRYHDLDARASRPAVQAADGSCDWSELRPFVDWHVSHGMVGVQVLGGTPAWDTDDTAADGYGRPGGAAVPRTWEGYAACVRSFCAEFGAAEVPYLSPWNEPYGPRSFAGTTADLVDAQRVLYAEAPDRVILTPSFYSLEHAREFLSACPRDVWDLLDVHLYGQTAEQLSATLDAYAALAPDVQFAITETGWQPQSQKGTGWRWPTMTPQQRAAEWLRICRMCEARGDVELLLWYSLDGYAKDETAIYTMGNRPELLAAQRAAVERKDMATVAATPTIADMVKAQADSIATKLVRLVERVNDLRQLDGQRAILLTTALAALAAAQSGGNVGDVTGLQEALDKLSQIDADIEQAWADVDATIRANPLPSTQVPAPLPPAPAAPAVKG